MFGSFIVDLLATLSIVGIYPRFIEPRRLKVTELALPLGPPLTIVHISDLHFHSKVSSKFLRKITRKVRRAKPDLVLFTGDFLCYSRLEDEERLIRFLNTLEAPLGCFCTLGNHDYAAYVSRNREGNYDVLRPAPPLFGLFRGLRSLFLRTPKGASVTAAASGVALHEKLTELLKKTPFTLLENTTVTLPCGLNIVGLGDFGLGRCRPETAFAGYQKNLPGIVLSHNPDSAPHLLDFPGELILSGHSHGGQIHFPPPFHKISQKLTRLENPDLARGLIRKRDKLIYVTRGLGCHKPFRFRSPPEIVVIRSSKDA